MNRRTLLERSALVTALGLGTGFVRPAALLAHPATPAASPVALDLPELVVAVDDTGFTLPETATAGHVVLTVKNTGTKDLHFFVTRIPDEVTDEQLASEMASDDDPAWFDMTILPLLGNPDWPLPGGEARGIVAIESGRWVFVDPLEGRNIAILNVKDSADQEFVAPVADVAVGLIEMDFTGLDEPISAGMQLWKIANEGATFHEVALIPVDSGTTKDEFIEQLGEMLEGQRDPAFFAPVGGQGMTAVGVTSWQWLELAAGTYAAVCMSPMLGGEDAFMPHAVLGMVRIFTVA